MKLQFNGVATSINENAYVSESVDIIGDVKVEENSKHLVWCQVKS